MPHRRESMLAAGLMTLAFLAGIAVTGGEVLLKRHIDCYWTDVPPVLDGKMDDACWQQAQVADSFVLLRQGTAPVNATEVRVCYDADNLYLFFVLYEQDMKNLKYGPPEDIRDNLDFTGDVAEIFLSPKRNDEYYHLCASPQGARYDAFIRDQFFNPDWQVVSGIHENRWTLEIAIPFTSLARDGEFYGTPAVDDVWGIQFCRDQGSLREWTSWRTREFPRFHSPEGFGTLRFAGRKDGKSAPSAKLAYGEIFFGARRDFGFELKGATGEITASLRTDVDGRKVFSDRKTVDSERFSFETPILEGGDWRLAVEAFQGDEKIYRGVGIRTLPPVVETFKTIADATIRADLAADQDYPGIEQLKKETDKLKAQCAVAVEQLESPDALSDEQWHDLVDLYDRVKTAWDEIFFKSQMMRIFAEAGHPDKPFALGQAGAQSKIYPYTIYDGPVNKPLRISLAGGETRSRQLVMLPFGRKLENVTVEFSPLRGQDNAEIAPENCRWFAVEYVHITERPVIRESFYHKVQPDILRERLPFDVEADSLRPLWLDIHLPRDTEAGLYHGTVKVNANGSIITVPLEVTAYGFDIPERATLKNDFWLYPDLRWRKFYGGFGENDYSPELHRRHAKLLSRYRVSAFLFGQPTYWRPANIKIFREKDGSFTFDLSRMEQFLDNAIEFGGNFFPASMGAHHANALAQFFRNHQVFDRASGKTAQLWDVYPEMRELRRIYRERRFPDALRHNRLYLDFMKVYMDLLRQKNLLDISYWEYHDEPNSNLHWNEMLESHAFYRKMFPEMQLSFFGALPGRSQDGRKSIGYVDIWAPMLRELADQEVLDEIKERRRKFGERFIFYTCNATEYQGHFTPFMNYHHSYLGPRLHAWMAHKFEADGFMSFMLTCIDDENMPDPDNPGSLWPEKEWRVGRWQGCGVLVYPGPDYEMIPSMRLASYRDGLQDYEYFVKLRDLQRYVDIDKHPELYAEIDRELTIEPAIIETVYIWTENEALLEAKREQLAALVETTRNLIREEAHRD